VASPQTREAATAALAVGGVLAVMWLYAKGKTPAVTFDPRSVTETYDPYSHFQHESPAAWLRHFPEKAAPNCLPLVYQNEDIGQAVSGIEVDRGGYAQ